MTQPCPSSVTVAIRSKGGWRVAMMRKALLQPFLMDTRVMTGTRATIDRYLRENVAPGWTFPFPDAPPGGWPLAPASDGLVVIDMDRGVLVHMQCVASVGVLTAAQVNAAVSFHERGTDDLDIASLVAEGRLSVMEARGGADAGSVPFRGTLADLARMTDVASGTEYEFPVDTSPLSCVRFEPHDAASAAACRDYLGESGMLGKADLVAWREHLAGMATESIAASPVPRRSTVPLPDRGVWSGSTKEATMAPKLIFKFQRQAWVKDNAVDTAPAEEIDVTEAFLELKAEEASLLFQETVMHPGMSSQDNDWFAERLGLFANMGKDGTGYLHMDYDPFAEFLKEVGMDPGDLEITEAGMAAARSVVASASAPAGPTPA